MRTKFLFNILSLVIASAFVFHQNLHAQNDMMSKRLTISKNEITLNELLTEVEKQVAVHFSYDPETLPTEMKMKFPKVNLTLKEVLDRLVDSYGLLYTKQGNVVILQKSRKKNQKTIRGIVTDVETGETLPGANVEVPESGSGTVSNQYGFYSLTIPEDEAIKIRVGFLGYIPVVVDFIQRQDSLLNISLKPSPFLLESITVTADSSRRSDISQGIGNYTITATKVKETMTFAGEPDALKTLQFLPGVQSGNEGTCNLSVRGGSFDQNLFLLDDAPVYNPSHALSFFSIFNPDALQSITLFKSAIPVSYGGRLSSVVNVRMKEGNRIKQSYSGSIGTIASRLTVEGPLSKDNDKLSYMLSGRYSYAGQIVNGIYLAGAHIFNDPTANQSTTDNNIDFYDFNAKINYRRNDKSHFYFSVYSGHDNFYFNHITSGYSLEWGNKTATMRWNYLHSAKLFSNTTAVFSNYNYQYQLLNNTQYFLWSAGFKELGLKQDYDFYPGTNHHITFGGGIESYRIKPGQVAPRDQTAVTRTYVLQDQQPVGTYLYLGNEQTISGRSRVVYGVRYSNFILPGPGIRYRFLDKAARPYDSVTFSKGEIEEVFHRLDPRIAFIVTRGKHTISASYDRTNQFFHLLANSSVGLPTDIWMPSGGSIEPQRADIYALTYQRALGRDAEGSFGGFYKRTKNLLDFRDNANLFVNRYVESQLLQGTGESYGIEFFLQKQFGEFSGSLSYTWSKAMNTIAGVNDGQAFPSRYDKRNNISLNGLLKHSRRWKTSFNYVYTTGGALTVPAGNFTFDGVTFNYYTARNNFRLPDYHRFDISWKYSPRKNDHRQYKSHWSFEVYNVYRRKNPFTVYSQQLDDGFFATEVKAFYLFGLVPSITYNFTF